MGFKADTSFLQYLSMGAVGVRQTMSQLRAAGFQPIELERYCGSNKIWATKVKRLRVPDVLCVRTGLRVEIKAKSALAIKMSDGAKRPWDDGLRNDDVIAYIPIRDSDGPPQAAADAIFFDTKDLRDSIATSKLGEAKSASEGAEKDRNWPACIPGFDGKVLSVDALRIKTELSRNDGSVRKQTYSLKGGKHAYVKAGDTFKGDASIISGTPAKIANINAFLNRTYDPLAGLQEENQLDRYAAVKALPYREELRVQAVPALEGLLATEQEPRVSLEAAGSAAKLGSALGETRIVQALEPNPALPFLPMEAVFILTELRSSFARQQLIALATNQQLEDDERRQAAIWGLGKAGMKAYETIVPLISDANENVAMHAIVSFGQDTPDNVLRLLVQDLIDGEPRRAASASEALRLSASERTVRLLIEAARLPNNWALATLGRLPTALVKPATMGTDLEAKLAPMLLLSEGAHWLSSEDRVLDIAFLSKQNLY